MFSGFITFIGRPNAGKSSLLNMIINQKVAGVSPKPQTTQRKVKGIYQDDEYQIIFLDTPGVYKSDKKSHINLLNTTKSALEGVELVIYVSDLSRDIGDEDEEVLSIIKDLDIQVLVLLNKLDLVKGDNEKIVLERQGFVKGILGDKIVETMVTSVKNGFGGKEVLDMVKRYTPEHEFYYDSVELDEQEIRDLAQEFISEACFNMLDKEVPYDLDYDIKRVEIEGNLVRIEASILTERESQKKLIIGQGGVMISKIGKMARINLESSLGKKVFLDLKVK